MTSLDEILSNGPEYINTLVNDSVSLAQFLNESLTELYERSNCYGVDQFQWKHYVTHIAVLVMVAVFSMVLVCCKCSDFNNKLNCWEAEYKNRFQTVEKDALKEIRSETFITEQIMVEDVEGEDIRKEEKKKKRKKKHHDLNKDKENTTNTNDKDVDLTDTDHSSDDTDDQLINIENSIVYITSNPPSPKHLK